MKDQDISKDPDMIELERMIDAGELGWGWGGKEPPYPLTVAWIGAGDMRITDKTKVKRRSGNSLELREERARED
jgi:hypothetical protein